ncbi:MAG: hypothetical protein IIX02_04150, partial [Clostridia bacterium]|nr:hypothetical protein [Clostridia bacterium]
MEYKATIRLTSLAVAVFIVIGIFIGRLYRVQISETQTVVSSDDTYTFLTHVPAARGNLLDRNGTVLVSNRASYNLTINDYIIYSPQSTNQNILNLVNHCNEMGLEYTDHLPISRQAPYSSVYE